MLESVEFCNCLLEYITKYSLHSTLHSEDPRSQKGNKGRIYDECELATVVARTVKVSPVSTAVLFFTLNNV